MGTYAKTPGNCIVRSPCQGLVANAVYITAGTTKDNCEWGCNAGFYEDRRRCVACPTPVGFNPLLHTFTVVCNMGCQAGISAPSLAPSSAPLWYLLRSASTTGRYRTEYDHKTCPPCVDLYPDGSAHGVHARVRSYGAGTSRPPAWLPNVCGRDGVVVPGAAALFRRNVARFVYDAGVAGVCGDSLLAEGEVSASPALAPALV